jgi:hypothetical protein
MKTNSNYLLQPKSNYLKLSIDSFKAVILVFSLILLYSCGSLTSLNYKSRILAVNRTYDQAILINVAINDTDWRVRYAAFNWLNNNSLTEICKLTPDQAIVIAAKIRLHETTWGDEFSKSTSSGIALGNLIGAIALVNSPLPASSDVVLACHKFIQLGDSSRIPELIYLLKNYGNVSLAEDYMNCGESTPEEAGCSWGKSHGYKCTSGISGSNRVLWGSKK